MIVKILMWGGLGWALLLLAGLIVFGIPAVGELLAMREERRAERDCARSARNESKGGR